MFKKKPNIKPLSPIKNSERRKLADHIISDLGLTVPSSDNADPEDKAGLTALRNSLLPDGSLSARFATTAGPDAKKVSGTIYVGAYPNQDLRVLWVKLEERVYPTVYTLWHNPGVLPLLHTPSFVVEKLQGGADLMTPGLQNGPPFPEKAKEGAAVAIASLESPTVPMAVGVCEIDVSALRDVRGAKGHAVKMIQWAGDELWAWSTGGKPGISPPEHLDGWLANQSDVEQIQAQLDAADLQDEDDNGGVNLPSVGKNDSRPAGAADNARDTNLPADDQPDVVEDKELTTKEIDEAFKNAFLYGVRHFMETSKNEPNYGLSFPLSQSFVMSNLVQPFLPAYTPAQAASLLIKKTSYKNIKKFIKSLDKAQIIKAKDQNNNEVVILDIDFEDQAIKNFKPYRLPKKETGSGSGKTSTSAATGDGSDSSVGQKLKRVELFKPKERLSPLFSAVKADPKGFYTPAELRPIVTAYIEAENLISPKNKRIVTMNPILANAVFDGSVKSDKDVINKGFVLRDALVDRVLASCAPFHAILRNDDTLESTKPKAGAAPRISIVLETRSGNKTVTKASGVEAYFVNPQALADELRKTCASSTSVERLVGSSPKNPVMEVMVQGPQKDAVLKALEKRGVPARLVEVLDKTKKKK
ncbi:uncharacterized protein J3D65DRAFT_645720 [Phyllosticta citribraziliensis]|uniref:SUI1 domain-containing protein n=1 Tax=Phyllosticta citribraziliensis TaxID=989973 RepID=A0ABR1LYH8_9PEZI